MQATFNGQGEIVLQAETGAEAALMRLAGGAAWRARHVETEVYSGLLLSCGRLSLEPAANTGAPLPPLSLISEIGDPAHEEEQEVRRRGKKRTLE